ncbi:MAG: hypothetical protein Q8Q12_07085 [bacterium]|nr:hypothetical protein [bacterium]
MQLESVTTVPSPNNDHRVRLVAQVSYDDKAFAPEPYWYDVPEGMAEFLSTSGNPWLVCLVPLAVTLGEPLRISKPVDRVLYDNVEELMLIWKCWYPNLHVVPVEAPVVGVPEHPAGSKTVAFFSGGVDSFFTVLRHTDPRFSNTDTRIDDLLCIWGFDIRLQKAEEFRRLRARLQRAATELGKQLVDVATNLKTTRLQQAEWGRLYHGCALASVALSLEKRYRTVLIASSHGYKDLQPWGSHPLADPLLSTSRTKVVHDGSAFDRVEKTELVANSDIAMRSLHVCYRGSSDKNCGNCNKCYRTMTTLALLGALNRCTTFPPGAFDVRRVAKVYSPDESDRSFFREIRAFALRQRRFDVVRAVDRSFRYSTWMNRLLPVLRSLKTDRFVWRVERALLAGFNA